LNNITKFSKCANCGACLNICPKDAISLDGSKYFYHYKVDEEKCIDCGACANVCPVNSPQPYINLKAAYGGWHTDGEVVRTSSSGGAFAAIADYVLSKDGIVYGAAYTADGKEVVCKSTDETSLEKIKRSKYVESAVGLAYRDIKVKLNEGRYVLFCGTPCQVAGLSRFLGKDYERLLTADFACGGLSSHHLYKEHLVDLEKRFHSKVSDVNFRPGTYGWKEYGLKVDFENGKTYNIPSILDPYVHSFMYSRYANRENCFTCEFRDSHFSDFILADYWMWNDYSNLPNNDTGISLILTNSDKAEKAMEYISQKMHLEKQDLNKANYNCRVKPPVSEAFLKKREDFWADFEAHGLKKASANAGMMTGARAYFQKLKISIRTKGIKNK